MKGHVWQRKARKRGGKVAGKATAGQEEGCETSESIVQQLGWGDADIDQNTV